MNKSPGSQIIGRFLFRPLMQTRIVQVIDLQTDLQEATSALKCDKPVVMPTETVYGLAASALSPVAAASIFKVKNRPVDNPLIVHISSYEMLKDVVELNEQDQPNIPDMLMPVLERFWPGPLTVLLPKGPKVSDLVTGGLETVAVRMPRHPIAKALIEQSGLPLAAPSANLSGRPSPTTAEHSLADLEGRVELILDGGKSSFGLESTVLNALVDPPLILRPGSITISMLKAFLPNIQIYKTGNGLEDRPPTPGLKYRHYSPEKPVILFYNHEKVDKHIDDWLSECKKIVRLVNDLNSLKQTPDTRYSSIVLSNSGDPTEIAHNLFDGLRAADAQNPDYIVCESVCEDDEGLAIMNRLAKAASQSVY